MALEIVRDPQTGEPVQVTMPYADWVGYAEWVRKLVEKGMPVPRYQPMPEIPRGLPDFGDPVEFQRRMRDGDA